MEKINLNDLNCVLLDLNAILNEKKEKKEKSDFLDFNEATKMGKNYGNIYFGNNKYVSKIMAILSINLSISFDTQNKIFDLINQEINKTEV